MNFKKIGLSLAAAVAVTAGTAVVEAPAQAASLAPGGFSLQAVGNPTVTQIGTGIGSTDKLNFSALNFNITQTTNALLGLTEAAGGIKVSEPLTLTSLETLANAESFSNAAVTSFITGLRLGADDVIFDLDSSNGLLSFTRVNNNYTGTSLSGVLRKAAGGAAIAEATIASLKLSGGLTNIQVETIPTPALLPGLIGLGLGVVRKRKLEANNKTHEAVEV